MVAGRARAVVVGVGPNTAMGSIRDSMLRTEDVSLGFFSYRFLYCSNYIINSSHFVFWHSNKLSWFRS